MRNRLPVAILVLALGGCASSTATPRADMPPAVDVTGRWTGQCTKCPATGFTLTVVQRQSDVTRTVIVAGRHAFGDSEKPILSGKVSGNQFTFKAKGDPGDLWDVELVVQKDGKTMEGNTYYRGPVRVKFVRASE